MEDLLLGIDLGGTKVEAALARPRGEGLEVLARRRVATERERGYDAILERAAALAEDVLREAGARAAAVPIGVGMPGSVTRAGLVKNSNTTCLNGRPFRDDLARRLARPVRFENDANCFALAEARLGAGAPHGAGVVFGAILGTGVGGGVAIGGRVWPGAQGIAGEWGHHRVDGRLDSQGGPGALPPRACYCGQTGCVEAYVSGPAVEADYARRAGARLPLAEIAARRPDDPHARAAVETLLEAFGRGLANVIDILDPSAVVLGGGVSNLDLLYDEGRARVARAVFNDELATPILRHALGDSAGVLGAALLVLDAPGPHR
jgi:fructokinase